MIWLSLIKKARFLIGVGGLIAVSFMVMIGYTIGSQSVSKQTEYQIRVEANKLVTKEKQKERATVLSDELVKKLLTQYFTKVQLGENNARINTICVKPKLNTDFTEFFFENIRIEICQFFD